MNHYEGSHLHTKIYLKNGKSDLKNSTTLQITNLILYSFYFMQIYHISTYYSGPNRAVIQKSPER